MLLALLVNLGFAGGGTVAPPADAVVEVTPAGRKTRKRYYVEIDGQTFPAESVEHARAILERATELSAKAAEKQLETVQSVKRLGLAKPVIKTNAPLSVKPYVVQIDRTYEQALIAAEIRLLLAEADDEEDTAYLLLF